MEFIRFHTQMNLDSLAFHPYIYYLWKAGKLLPTLSAK